MPFPKPGEFTAPYAETKAMGERAVAEWAQQGKGLAVNVAPHQVLCGQWGVLLLC